MGRRGWRVLRALEGTNGEATRFFSVVYGSNERITLMNGVSVTRRAAPSAATQAGKALRDFKRSASRPLFCSHLADPLPSSSANGERANGRPRRFQGDLRQQPRQVEADSRFDGRKEQGCPCVSRLAVRRVSARMADALACAVLN